MRYIYVYVNWSMIFVTCEYSHASMYFMFISQITKLTPINVWTVRHNGASFISIRLLSSIYVSQNKTIISKVWLYKWTGIGDTKQIIC